MALIGCDGFDSYAAGSDFPKKWDFTQSPWTWNSSGSKFSSGCAVAATTGAGKLARLLTITAPVCMAFWGKISAAPASVTWFAGLTDSGGNISCGFRLNTDGTVSCTSGLPNNVSGTTGQSMADGNWHWFEMYVNGSFNSPVTAYVDGVFLGSSNGQPALSGFGFASVTGITISIDDAISYDSTSGGVQVSSYPLGSRQITTIRPASDGTVTFGTVVGGTGSHASSVNEVNPDGDTSYVQDATSGHQDLYNYGPLGYSPSNITAVVVNNYIENSAGGTINFQTACKSGATTSLAASVAVPVTYKTVQQSFNVDPNTSAAWTPTGLASAQFGIKVP